MLSIPLNGGVIYSYSILYSHRYTFHDININANIIQIGLNEMTTSPCKYLALYKSKDFIDIGYFLTHLHTLCKLYWQWLCGVMRDIEEMGEISNS